MKARELRKYNYVLFKGEVIKLIGNYDLFKACVDCERNDDYQPIPLNEEWLLKFGFKKEFDSSFCKNDFSLFLDKRFKTNLYLQTNEDSKKFEWFGYECKVEHVHQLQNLYFALTNKELEIKEI